LEQEVESQKGTLYEGIAKMGIPRPSRQEEERRGNRWSEGKRQSEKNGLQQEVDSKTKN